MRVAPEIHLTKSQRATLQRWSRGRTVAVRQAQRAKMILRAAEGKSNQEIAALLGVKVHTVGRWRNRFAELGIAGIEKDLPRGGRPRQQRERSESEIIRKTTQETPTGVHARWPRSWASVNRWFIASGRPTEEAKGGRSLTETNGGKMGRAKGDLQPHPAPVFRYVPLRFFTSPPFSVKERPRSLLQLAFQTR